MNVFVGTFTRPADTTAYASGDLVANSTVAGSVVPLILTAQVSSGTTLSGLIRRARLRKSTNVLTNASFRLHLYTTVPAVTNGDNGAWLSNKFDKYLGSIDITVDKAFSDGSAGQGVPGQGSEILYALAGGEQIRGLLEARAAYTPGNGEVFSVTLETLDD